MENQFDNWLSSNLQVPHSVLKENLQKSTSSQVIGRKINSQHTIKSKNLQTDRPKIIEIPISGMKNSTSRGRNKSLSKSPILRCNSHRQIRSEKEQNRDLSNIITPPRQYKKKESKKNLEKSARIEIKKEKSKIIDSKSMATESVYRLKTEKSELLKKTPEEKGKKLLKKKEKNKSLKKIGKKIKKISKNMLSVHPKPWGCDQKVSKIENISKSIENDELRSKIRAERELSRKDRRKAIGLAFVTHSKPKVKKETMIEEKPKPKKSPDPNIQNYIKHKNKTQKLVELQKQMEENLKERERVHALEKLEKTVSLRKKSSKKKKKTKNFQVNEEKSSDLTYFLSTTSRPKSNLKKKKTREDSSEFLSERLKKIQDRIYNTYDSIKSEAATRIQRWYRSVKKGEKTKIQRVKVNKRSLTEVSMSSSSSEKYLNTEYEEWVSFVNPSSKFQEVKNEIIEKFKASIEKNKRYEHEIDKTNQFSPENNSEKEMKSFESSENESRRVLTRHKKCQNLQRVWENSEKSIQQEKSGRFENLLSMSQQKFQLKRPRELDIESINTPLITMTINSEVNSSSLSQSNYLISDSNSKNIYENSKTSSKFSNEISPDSLISLKHQNLHSFPQNFDSKSSENPIKIEEFYDYNESFGESSSSSEKFSVKNKNTVKKTEYQEKSEKFSEEYSLHSFQNPEKKIDSFVVDEKDSLENDIIDISSALTKIEEKIQEECGFIINKDSENDLDLESPIKIPEKPSENSDKIFIENLSFPSNFKTSLINLSIPEEIPEPNFTTCPISSPNISVSISDMILEVIETELSLYLSIIPFELKEKEVDPSFAYIESYLKEMFQELIGIEQEILEAINTPVYQEPLMKLKLLQNSEIGELSKFLNLELILPIELCSQLKVKNKALDLSSRQNYLQMLFDCVNEALNYIRPFGLKGMPDPWSNHPRTLFGEAELKNVFAKLKTLLKKWDDIKGGAFPTRESWEDEDKVQEIREERMSILLCYDANEEEKAWVDYDDEEAQAKFDLGDILMEELILETLYLLHTF